MAGASRDFPICPAPRPTGLNECRGTARVSCTLVAGHAGGHKQQGDYCNRPDGHDGPHRIYTYDAQVLAEWTDHRATTKKAGVI